MKKQAFVKIVAFLAAFMIASTCIILPQTDEACASSTVLPWFYATVKFDKNMTLELAPGDGTMRYRIDMGDRVKKGQKVTFKVKNEKLIGSYNENEDVIFVTLKTGKTKLTAKVGNKTYKANVKVVKYKNNIKLAKIKNKNITKDFKKGLHSINTIKGNKGKLKIKVKPGCKIKKIVLDPVDWKNGKKKKVKNGAVINLKKYNSITVHIA